jgi:hypothetical protein
MINNKVSCSSSPDYKILIWCPSRKHSKKQSQYFLKRDKEKKRGRERRGRKGKQGQNGGL